MQSLFDGRAEFVEVERFNHHASETAADLRVFAEPDRVGRHEDQRQVGLVFAQAVSQPHAVAVRQRQIDQGQGERVLAGQLQRLGDAGRRHDGVAVARQDAAEHVAEHVVVIDEQNRRGIAHGHG